MLYDRILYKYISIYPTNMLNKSLNLLQIDVLKKMLKKKDENRNKEQINKKRITSDIFKKQLSDLV